MVNLVNQELARLKERLEHEGGKILVIQTAFLGDVILLTSLLRVTRRMFPKITLSVLTIPQSGDVLNGMADEIIIFDKHSRENHNSNWRDLIGRLKRYHFDLALIPHRSFRSGLTAYKAGIPCRIGFSRGVGSIWHTHRVKYQYNLYEGRRNLKLLELFSQVNDNGLPELHPAPDDEKIVTGSLDRAGLANGRFVIFAPGSIWKSKRWSEECYRALHEIIYKESDCAVVLIGGKDDAELCSRIASDSSLNFAGRLTPLQSAALARRALAMVSGDSAPAHIATSMGLKQIIIFGSTSPRFGFAPSIPQVKALGVDIWCRPCSDHGRNMCPRWGSYRCLKGITPSEVFTELHAWL